MRTPPPTEHIPQPLKMYVVCVLKFMRLLGGGWSLDAPLLHIGCPPYYYSHAWAGKSTLYNPVVTIFTARLTFNVSTFCPHSVYMCFLWIWEQTAIISLYSIDWLVFITEAECVYCAVRSTFCPHSVFMCFVWIWEQTAIISLYSFNWLVGLYNCDGVCLLRGTDLYFICISA